MRSLRALASIGVLLGFTILTAASVRAQDSVELATARDLYASAAYDDALTVLNQLRSADHPAEQSRMIEQYRAFCLLALGRSSDAETAIEAVVVAEPSYRPSDSEASPRVQAAFTTVRRRMLPIIIQQQYAQAKAAFDRKDWTVAADGFRRVNTTLADEDLAALARQSPLADLGLLANGFGDLSARAAAPPPPPTTAATAVRVAAAAPSVAQTPRIYSVDDANVRLPVALNQSLPAFPGLIRIPRSGKIEVVIDESGAITSAVMTSSVTSWYDNLAVAAARTWRFRPATVDGTPVKFRQVIQINIKKST